MKTKRKKCCSIQLIQVFVFSVIFFSCHSPAEKVRIVLFDMNDFNKVDTFWIVDKKRVSAIESLFANREKRSLKFAMMFQLTIFHNDGNYEYYGRGKFVKSKRESYLLPEGKNLKMFENLLDSLSSVEGHSY